MIAVAPPAHSATEQVADALFAYYKLAIDSNLISNCRLRISAMISKQAPWRTTSMVARSSRVDEARAR